jgi:hypothetical protein
MFREDFRNSFHESNTFNPNFPSHFIKMDFYLQIIMGQQSVQWLGYMLEDRVVKSWQEQQNCLFSRTSKPSPAPTQPPTPAVRADSLTTHICLEPSLKISAAIPPLNLSPSMTHSGTNLFYLNHLPMYIPFKRSHPLRSYKGTFLYITYPLHAHYMTHLFHLHWSNYINIMNSSNNKPHYITSCVLLLTPSIGRIFSWQLFS